MLASCLASVYIVGVELKHSRPCMTEPVQYKIVPYQVHVADQFVEVLLNNMLAFWLLKSRPVVSMACS